MNAEGASVRTVKPEKEANDWQPEALLARKWGVKGTIIKRSDRHGLIFEVRHEDGTTAWYEPRELQLV